MAENQDLKIKTAAGKVRYDLLPVHLVTSLSECYGCSQPEMFLKLTRAARAFEYGAMKYAPWNYLRADATQQTISRYVGAALRHFAQGAANLDLESGLPHICHEEASLLMLTHIIVGDWHAKALRGVQNVHTLLESLGSGDVKLRLYYWLVRGRYQPEHLTIAALLHSLDTYPEITDPGTPNLPPEKANV